MLSSSTIYKQREMQISATTSDYQVQENWIHEVALITFAWALANVIEAWALQLY